MSEAKATNEELRHFFRERALIEEDYAKRLQKLAKLSLGEHETGTTRASIDVLKLETASTANQHTAAAQQLSKEVEQYFATLATSIRERRKHTQSSVERVFRLKLQQQAEVKRTKERYESDCVKISGYLAQQNLLLGRELEKNNAKLEKLQSTLHLSQAEYDTATRALQGTINKWVTEWKDACDAFQDLEEERLDSVKSGLWTYANIVSTVCVTDDESCEKLRVSLESCDPTADIQAFIDRKKTGSEIMHPPEVTSFQDGYDQPLQQAFSLAKFERLASQTQKPFHGALAESTNSHNQKRTNSVNGQTKTIESVINQHPLDGITQLCRSDSNATFASESTGIATSSIYSPVPPNSHHTPSASISVMDKQPVRGTSPMRKKSISERMDSVLYGRHTGLNESQAAPALKAQKTGSIFDVLKPSRSRSRGNLRASASMPADVSGTSSLVSHTSAASQGRTLPSSSYLDSGDPISQALENLKLRSRTSNAGQSVTRWPENLAPRRHTRVPSLSEPTTPAASDIGLSASFQPSQRNSLVAPAPAHSADEMRQVEQIFANRLSGTSQGVLSTSFQDIASPVFGRPPGDLRRSPSPQPALSNQLPQKRHTYTTGMMEQHRVHARDTSPDHGRAADRRGSNVSSQQGRPPVQTGQGFSQLYQSSNRTSLPFESDSRYSSTHGRGPFPEQVQAYHPLNRTRSKSFADLSSARPRYTPDGVEILHFATALYDYQATIPEEIGFGQGDTLAIVETREDGWWLGQVVGLRNARRGLVPSNFFSLNTQESKRGVV
jgi:hypothetical protein